MRTHIFFAKTGMHTNMNIQKNEQKNSHTKIHFPPPLIHLSLMLHTEFSGGLRTLLAPIHLAPIPPSMSYQIKVNVAKK